MIKNPLLRFFIGLIIAICLCLVLYLLFVRKQAISTNSTTLVTPLPSLTPTTQTQSFDSPDGKKKFILQVENAFTNGKTYTFSIISGSVTTPIFAITSKITYSIPFNSWSPDGKYIWIEKDGNNRKDALVFSASGDKFATGDTYYDVGALYDKRGLTNTYSQATGWASETLLIIETSTSSGQQGTSYWFDVPSQSFIPLATQF